MKVDISDKRELHNPHRTDASIQTLTRYTAYTSAAVAQTDETVVIDASFLISEVIDRADLAQSGYVSQMESADHMGVMLNEKIESYIYAQHAQFTDFDNAAIGGSAGNIDISETNVDEVITGMLREIHEAKGSSLLERNGAFIVWRPADFEKLTRFMMANGFSTADNALKNGVKGGIDYMGVTHYQSNLLTAGHLFGGVKKVAHLGILRATYGQIVVDEKDPGLVSGVGITSRIDIKVKAWAKTAPVLFDILVA
ncbi:hypothetical protein [Bradyrhizobium sp. AUGA SZCCT0431]|uniref:hypothetical protein n=1 Tax=Bradyrhizobium sp. AUGA SZCCT0431 TaxID=2807674 RepID=UPI001BAADC32|nr:hypothetical protein [Bradyrhizobium sp. AUGA SZCCT0431]MBR1146679.1 hypothetical protein [Bradyrhizobium sp. AUGA SZCCT0431]